MPRTRPLIALLCGLALLSGCTSGRSQGTSDQNAPDELNSTSPVCLQLARDPGRVGENTYPTDAGRIRLTDSRVELVRDSNVTILSSDVSRIVDVLTNAGTTLIYAVRPTDTENAELVVIDLDGRTRTVGLAEAPEYQVTSVAPGVTEGHLVLTAISDLTEVIVETDASGKVLRQVEPYEYNQAPYLLTAQQLPDGRFYVVESPESDNGAWAVSLLTPDGDLLARLPLPDRYGTYSGWVDRGSDGLIALGTDRAVLVITNTDGVFNFSECSTTPRDRIIRKG